MAEQECTNSAEGGKAEEEKTHVGLDHDQAGPAASAGLARKEQPGAQPEAECAETKAPAVFPQVGVVGDGVVDG